MECLHRMIAAKMHMDKQLKYLIWCFFYPLQLKYPLGCFSCLLTPLAVHLINASFIHKWQTACQHVPGSVGELPAELWSYIIWPETMHALHTWDTLPHTHTHTETRTRVQLASVQLVSVRQRKMQMTRHYVQQQQWQQSQQRSENWAKMMPSCVQCARLPRVFC